MNYKIAVAVLVIPMGVTSLLTKSVSAAEVTPTLEVSQSPMVLAQRYDDRRDQVRQDELGREQIRRDQVRQDELGREQIRWEEVQRNQIRRDDSRRVWVAGHYEPGFLGIGRKWVEGHWEDHR